MNKQVCKILFILMISVVSVASAIQPAFAKSSKVLLLPFTVNAPDPQTLSNKFTALMVKDIKKKGFRVDVYKGNADYITIDEAKSLAGKTGSDYVLYGVINQLGSGFNIETRFVSLDGELARPYHFDGTNIKKIDEAVTNIVTKLPHYINQQDTIRDIFVQGLQTIDPARLYVRIQSKKGEVANIETMDEDVRNIWNLGYFSDVSVRVIDHPTKTGERLLIEVVEKPLIKDVRVEGSDIISENDVIDAMSSQKGTILNEKILVEDLMILKELYRKKGYYLADIAYTVEGGDPKQGSTLILNVNAGNKLYITELNLNGVDAETQKIVRKAMKLRERDIFSWFTKSGILNEEYIQRDTQALQAALVDNGYLDAVVATPRIEYEKDGIIVNFDVKQGNRYKLGNIVFSGDLLETSDVLATHIGLDEVKVENGYFSLRTMQNDVKSLKELYNDYGYAFAEVNVDTSMNKENSTVDVRYILIPKEKAYIRNVILEGNTTTRDNVILRELRLADGQQYDGAKLRRTIERLHRLQYFEDVNADLLPTNYLEEVDLKLMLKEKSTGQFGLGIGYSTYDKLGVNANMQKNNLFGRGYRAGINGYVSSKTTSIRASFVNPRINDTYLGFMVSVYAEDEEWIEYDKRTVGSTVGLVYPLGEYTGINLSYRLEFYSLTDVMPNASSAIQSYTGDNIASVLSTSISRDTTNHPIYPTRGTKQNIGIEYGGNFLGGSDNFVKLTGTYGFYFGITDAHILHARGTAGAIYKNTNSIIPAFERFYIGGINSLRGYDYEDISPIDRRTGESIGGTRMGYVSAEYIWRMSKEFGFYLVPFFDIGTSFDDEYQKWDDVLYYSTGLELRWNSPLGSLRFAYGYPLTKSITGETLPGRFEFSMGNVF